MTRNRQAKKAKMETRWLHHKHAFFHRDFIPDAESPLLVVRRLPGTGNVIVQLPNGAQHILPWNHTADCQADEQREIDAILEAD